MTGIGKGLFNIFVGSILLNIGLSDSSILNKVMGPCIMGSGFIFLFLSLFRNMSDEELQRAVSVQK
jgi:hypothetical protein